MGDVELGGLPRPPAPPDTARTSGDALLDPPPRHARRRACDGLANAPHKHCNATALAASTVALLFLSLWVFAPRAPRGVTGPRGDAAYAPEGGLSGSYAVERDYRGAPRQVTTAGGVVVADHGRCSDVGVSILRRGGNAADAGAAAALCQGVLNPMASGIGGGTIILWRGADGRAEVIDGRETAPAAATASLYASSPPNATLDGGLAVATPLELLALHALVVRHGSGNVSWGDVVAPAAALAREPWPAHPYYVSAVSSPGTLARLRSHPALAAAFLVPGGRGQPARPPRVGEKCCARPALADTLTAVGQHGPAALYTDRAAALAADVRAAGGVLSEEDVKSARARVAPPLTTRVWGLDLLYPPPPSAAASLTLAAAIAAGYDTPPTFGGKGGGAHRLVEAEKHGMALRASLGDSGACGGGVDVGVDGGVPAGGRRRRRLAQEAQACFDGTSHVSSLLSDASDPAFADALRSTFNETATLPVTAYGGRWGLGGDGGAGLPPDDHGTSHLVAIDATRNAVSLTTTVNTGFGSGVLSESTGVLLNNQMDDFSVEGRANGYGLAAQPANFIAPGKKPLSSMAPIMLVSRPRGGAGVPGTLRAVVGASGGPRILTAVLATLVRLVEGGETPLAAVTAPRLHHQLLPDAVFAEDWAAGALVERVPPPVVGGLEARGHAVRHAGWGAVVQAAVVSEDGGSVDAASDPRKDGAPAVAE